MSVAAQIDAFVADKHVRAGNQRFHFVLGLATEGAIENGWRRWILVPDGLAGPRLSDVDLGGQDVPVLVAERLCDQLQGFAMGDFHSLGSSRHRAGSAP